jgi:hypothetical protein
MAECDPEPDPGQDDEERDALLPVDEEAAWEQIVAGYGQEPENAEPETEAPAAEDGRPEAPAVRTYTVYAAGTGPRDWPGPAAEDDEHFVPPEPPPLPETDTTTKFGWLGALGGPLLLLGAILFHVDFTWWLLTLGVGGFIGGCLTLATRLRPGDEDDWEDPGGGAVV